MLGFSRSSFSKPPYVPAARQTDKENTESVADQCKKPLLRIDASLLGTSVKSVETGLSEALRLAEKWRAVALLDEADVFMEQRTTSDLERNGLVSG